MAAVGGSIEAVAISGRNFSVAADTEAQIKLGGFENEIQANGDGTTRTIKTRVVWMVDGLSLNIDLDAGDLEFLQDLTDNTVLFPIAITYASGTVHQGTGQITGETQYSSQNTVATVSLQGFGRLTRQ